MKINDIAKVTGLTPKTIRFYEQKGIISEPARLENGYRAYSQQHINELQMIRRSRLVGFSLEECRTLLDMSRNPNRRSADVKQKALDKIAEIDEKIQELQAMKTSLKSLASACPGDDSACCPIIEALSSGED
ncbi:Cu(I)-responsive transcriptional regulator [Grimontia hollisae]|uniref:HTH-type transcriptional regulator CueR n=2 Tax=Grimontia hollisae TaxID=673 RepID=D0I7E9_GRIHO|nr:Cu(I)-responsive transcriptional regulator [Grimontia hollisae]AMG31279.1 Cu(I)-responsive transcriptional regulator [Grimontia hollisae]EEY72568.1 HTH-type transcriptional regulator CueR [Grimontia hollisae CIP 101886]MDF2185603.1 Cu(I)-responsive transcriptional regulator [Grimontia hollisae]STO46083.1 Copper export regulator [Grimontia hollisae]STO58157.1 Copper export regulator [Grimontia hollisae]